MWRGFCLMVPAQPLPFRQTFPTHCHHGALESYMSGTDRNLCYVCITYAPESSMACILSPLVFLRISYIYIISTARSSPPTPPIVLPLFFKIMTSFLVMFAHTYAHINITHLCTPMYTRAYMCTQARAHTHTQHRSFVNNEFRADTTCD